MTRKPQNDFDALLDHAGWIQQVAQRLVRDHAAADDLVQDTWTAALRTKQRGETRSWLGTVLRNVWRERHRSDRARVEREIAVARPDGSLPSAAELAERVERQRLLASHVTELPEPYRATVILRFYEGLTSAEIARRTGEPADRVRWRLKRGLELLRERLQREHGHGWSAWCASVLPLGATGTAAGAAATVTLGVWLMSAKTMSLGAAAIVIAGLSFWWFDSSAAETADSTPVSDNTVASDGSPGVAVPELDDIERVDVTTGPAAEALGFGSGATGAGAETTSVVFGTVTAAEEGEALEGVEVFLYHSPRHVASRRVTRTDAEGRFRFEDVAPRDYGLAFLAPPRAPFSVSEIEVGASPRRVDAELRLGVGCDVEVVDAKTGEPVSDAEVMLIAGERKSVSISSPEGLQFRSVEATSDGDGQARLRGVSQGPHQVVVRADGYGNWIGRLRAGAVDSKLRAELRRGATLSGRVTRADDGPVAGTHVFVQTERSSKRLAIFEFVENAVEVAADGSYRIRNVPAGRHRMVAVAPDGLCAFHLDDAGELAVLEVEDAEDRRVDLPMPLPVTLRGRVLSDSGEPIEGARAYVSWRDMKPSRGPFFHLGLVRGTKQRTEHDTNSDADGRFLMTSLRPSYEPLHIEVSREGFRGAELIIDGEPGAILERDVVLHRLGAKIRGRLTAIDGGDVTGVTMGAWELHEGKRGALHLATPAADGSYEFALPNDVTHFEVYPILRDHDPFTSEPERRLGVASGATEIDFSLRPRSMLRGVLVDEDGAPIRSFHLHVLEKGEQTFDQRRGMDLGGGRFRVRIDPQRHVEVAITAAGFAPIRIDELEGTDERRIIMKRASALRSRVVDANGQGVGGAFVCLATLDSKTFPLHSEHAPSATTEADGKFVLEGIGDDPGYLLVCPNDAAHPPLVRIPLSSLDPRTPVVTLPTSRTVTIEFAEDDGSPVDGEILILDRDGWPLEPFAEKSFRDLGAKTARKEHPVVDGKVRIRLADGPHHVLFAEGAGFQYSPAQQFAMEVRDGATTVRFEVR